MSLRKSYKIHEGHQKASVSQDTPHGKENETSSVDNKVTFKENEMENVEKVDEIVRLDYKSVKTTMKQVPGELSNIKTDAPTGTVFQPVTETLTSEYKSAETSKIMEKPPDINKSKENLSLADAPPANIQATDNIMPHRSVEADKVIKNIRTSYVEAKDEIWAPEYKSVETNKVVMEKVPDISEPQRNNANIIDTPSGSVAMAIENTFLDKLEKKLIENPNTHVYLRELNSRQLIVDFKPQENVSNLKVHVTKSPTGEIQFVLFKNLSTYMRPCESCETVCEQAIDVESLILKVVRSECKLKGTPTDGRKVCDEAASSISNKRQAARKTAKMEREDIRNFIEDVILNKIPKEAKMHKCRLTDKERNSIELDKKEMEIFYDNNRGEIKLNVQGENGAKACVEANLRRTLSGNIVMDIKDMNCVGVIADSSKECPVLLKKSSSGAYMLFVGYEKPEQEPNTILKRTESGQMLIVITEPILKSLILPKPPLQELANHKLYKVSVKSASSRIIAIPAFLKMTTSGNYLLVLDKEFEKQFNDHIMNSMSDHNQCHIELQKTASDDIVINFDKQCTENTCHNKQNALLVKTSSGHLRILVNDEKYNTLSQNLIKVNSNKSSKAFEELLRHIHTLSSPGCSQSKDITERSFRKQSSESQFLDSDNSSHFDRPIKIQKTPSGQYAVVLDKNSKMAFLTDLRNYLNLNNKGHVPVRRMGSGDIMIFLDPEGQSTDLYGSSRVTPSGNVYVTMDENVLKVLSAKPSGMTELGSHHIIKKVMHPENKGVDTNCSTDLDACLCDPFCICRDLLECVDKRRRSQDTKRGYFYKTKKILPCPSKCYASCCMKNRFNRTNVTESPCECLNPSYNEQKSIHQCYYVHESLCNMNKTLSNELLVASCSSKETDNSTSLSEIFDDSVEEFPNLTSYESEENSKYDWNYLPPQLPPFLNNFKPFAVT